MAGTVYFGDAVLLYCTEVAGYVYSEPCSQSVSNFLTIVSSTEEQSHLPNTNFAIFHITFANQEKVKTCEKDDHIVTKPCLSLDHSLQSKNIYFKKSDPDLVPIVYGSLIKLQHAASGKYLSTNSTAILNLEDDFNESSVFRLISPREEVHWGKILHTNDTIHLENVLHKGLVIQCVYDPPLSKYCLVLGLTGSIFSIKSHCQKLESIDHSVIRGGSILMLQSLKFESYACAEGSFVNADLPQKMRLITSLIGMYHWKKVHRFVKESPYSGDTYFHLEKADNPLSGDPIQYGDECRIKHLATQNYIAFSEDNNKIVLQDSKSLTGSEIFKISSIDMSALNNNTIVSFDEVTFEHVQTKKLLDVNVRPEIEDPSTNNPISYWFKLVLTGSDDEDSITQGHAFHLELVEQAAVRDMYYVFGLASFLCAKLKIIPLLMHMADEDDKTAEKLSYHLLDIRVEMKGLVETIQKSLKKKRLTNMLRIIQVVDVMIALLHVIGVTTEELKMTSSGIFLALENYVASGNRKTRHYLAKRAFLRCILDFVGKGIGAEQVLIVLTRDDCVMATLMKPFLLCLAESFGIKNSEMAKMMSSLVLSSNIANIELNKKMLQRALHSEMLCSYDIDAIETLDRFVCMPCDLYLHCCGHGIRNFWHIHNYSGLTIDTFRSVKLEFDEVHSEENIEEIRASVSRYLSGHKEWVKDEEHSAITAQVLGVLKFLINYGYINNDYTIEVINCLLNLIKSTLDVAIKRMKNPIIYKVQALTLKCLHLLLMRGIRFSAKYLLHDFKAFHEREYYNLLVKQHSASTGVHVALETTMKGILHNTDISYHENLMGVCEQNSLDRVDTELYSSFVPPPTDMKKLLTACETSDSLIGLCRDRLKYLLKLVLHPLFDSDSQESLNFCESLSKLISDPSDADLQVASAELLFDMYAVESHTLSEAQMSYILTTSASTTIISDIRKLVSTKVLLKMINKQSFDKPQLLHILENISLSCIVGTNETKSNVDHQEIVYSSGLFTVILEFIVVQMMSEGNHDEDIVNSFLLLLRRVARKNSRAQKELHRKWYDLIKVTTHIPSMTLLLNEMFMNSVSLCKKLTMTDFKEMFYTAVGSSIPEHAEIVITIKQIIKTLGVATSLQEYVTQLVISWTDNRSRYSGLNKPHKIKKFLKKADDDSTELQLLLNICDLVAICTEGECHFALDFAQNLFHLDDLVVLLASTKIKAHRKLPFVQLLSKIYLNSEKDLAHNCQSLTKNRLFWSHIEEQIILVNEIIVKEIAALNDQEKDELKQQLLCVNEFGYSVTQWMKVTINGQEKPMEEFYSTLIYIVEGLIPLVSIFCSDSSLYLTGFIKSPNDLFTPQIIAIITDFGIAVQKIHSFGILECSKQLINLLRCLENISLLQRTLQIEVHNNFDEIVVTSLRTQRKMETNLVLEQGDEARLNKSLQIFITNFREAYNDRIHLQQNTFAYRKRTVMSCPNPRFKKLVELFSDLRMYRNVSSPLKAERLLQLLQTLMEMLQRQIIDCLERIKLENLTISALKVLCCVICVRIVGIPSGDIDIIQLQYKQFVEPLQKQLIDSGAIELLIKFLHHPGDDITFQVLSCLNALLFAGCEEAQTRILSLVGHQNQDLFVRVHLILHEALLALNQAKMESALAYVSETNELVKMSRSIAHQSLSDVTQPLTLTMLKGTTAKDSSIPYIIYHRVSVVLNVLSWLCNGQKSVIQNILRETISEPNIVNQVAFILHGIADNLTDNNLTLAHDAVQALIEICTGNHQNQELAFNGQVLSSVNSILKEDCISITTHRYLLNLKASCIELLEVILEHTGQQVVCYDKCIVNQLDIFILVKAMFELWCGIPYQKEWQKNVFCGYHVLKKIADSRNISVDELVGYSSDLRFTVNFGNIADEGQKMWAYCQLWSRSIEVVYKAPDGSEILNRVYFPHDPQKSMSEKEKDRVLQYIKRSSHQEKLTDLLHWTESIQKNHRWKAFLQKRLFTRWILFAPMARHLLLFWLTILLNLMILFSFKVPPRSDSCGNNSVTCNNTQLYLSLVIEPQVPVWYHGVLYSVGSIYVILALWMVLQYFTLNWINLRFEVLFIKKWIYYAKKKLLQIKNICKFNVILKMARHINRPRPGEYFDIFIFSFQPIYRMLFLLFSVLALAFNGYFYCGCVLYLFLNNTVLFYILRAVGKSAVQLIVILILGLVVIYIYAVISFAFISGHFDSENDLFCETLFQCFVTVIRVGLVISYAIAVPLRPSSDYPPSFNALAWRTVYDVIFLIVVTLLGFNIVIAILVDTFSDLRQEKDKIDYDIKSRCFICNINKEVFENYGLNFEKHLLIDHNMWNYIQFALYLDTADPNELNALEKYVYTKLPSKSNPGSIDFFPIQISISLPNSL